MFENEGFQEAWDGLRSKVRLPMYGCDCYAYGLVAAGHADLVAECDMKPYDYLAHVPIIQGAGGVITDWQVRIVPQLQNEWALFDSSLIDNHLIMLSFDFEQIFDFIEQVDCRSCTLRRRLMWQGAYWSIVFWEYDNVCWTCRSLHGSCVLANELESPTQNGDIQQAL